MVVEPIGIFRSEATFKFTLPRQGMMHSGHWGVVELSRGRCFEQALRDLDGFERIWLIFQFHENTSWRPTVRPPIPPPDHERIGVFASRSPYRPNPIGLSCVRLIAVEPLRLVVDEADLLDGTPILDIKPYLPKADAFPDAACGWVESQNPDVWQVAESAHFHEQSEQIRAWQGPDLASIANVQLRENPFDSSRKRVTVDGDAGELAIRMFRVVFTCQMDTKRLTLEFIRSGYPSDELADLSTDPYGDKELHRLFVSASATLPQDRLGP